MPIRWGGYSAPERSPINSPKDSLEGNGFHYEPAEVMRCLREARLESEIMPLDETLGVMAILDRIRSQWGLKYPMEQEG